MRSSAIDEPGSPVRALYATLATAKFQQLLAASKWLSLFQGISIHTANTQNQADPYVCLRLVPNSRFWKQLSASNWDLFVVRFSDTPKHRTQTQRRTLFPLFDETFDLWVESLFFSSPLSWQSHFSFVSGAHKRRENAYLQILVKDRGLMGQVWTFDWNQTMVWNN